MKDIIISSKQIKKELVTLMVCFIIGFIANIGAIIYYKSTAIEMFTSLHYVLIFSGFIYGVWSFLRLTKGLLIKIIK